ncbi:PP2C family protein-serine/threonine phosphatase [Phytomonospora endophytica]|uniref:Serine phosphatase RsbU (Regulator of sigma subunit) n=1 Tax=Phytomonospora endophytica TaxID=714109 RepID=A0A841FI30_9ACTN|nr:PP2C family protein-serine/threonine phosphatase [Phytomonospora endophytica]MBB6035866.1 serine phosphatase RsbU (regulator of sigma subunit) [Phytomonospora endophytica]
MLGDLLGASHLMPLELLPARTAECAAHAGIAEVVIYLGDLQRRTLRLVPGVGTVGDAHADEIAVEATVPGRAYQLGITIDVKPPDEEGFHWWVPLIDGTDRLGLLRVRCEYGDEHAREDVDRLAALVALIVVSKRDNSDTLARLVRTEPLSIAAEMQWRLTNARSYADGRVVISASMEPAYQISGDAFDYGTDGPFVHLSIFDAMGHDMAAGLTANLAVAACRNGRRQGADLLEVGDLIEAALIEQYRYERYATGVLATLDTRTGEFTWVNRGHPPPMLIRGSRWSTILECPPSHPMGTGLDVRNPACVEQLEPGDRILLYTDGITDARNREGESFGRDRFSDFLIRRHADRLPVPETLRRFTETFLEHHDGHLRDDATILLCEWLGPSMSATDHAAALTGVVDPNPATRPEGDPASAPIQHRTERRP